MNIYKNKWILLQSQQVQYCWISKTHEYSFNKSRCYNLTSFLASVTHYIPNVKFEAKLKITSNRFKILFGRKNWISEKNNMDYIQPENISFWFWSDQIFKSRFNWIQPIIRYSINQWNMQSYTWREMQFGIVSNSKWRYTMI